ncbi:YkvA family protein [Flammeovirga aprica]|uniref:DUF1232 domain-containing protein n=1 Tax=Flammeovirga aprica JL-4 TaxID=694437 RepID=A0A7X9RYX0_9BACT|nr:YkvA family protein [Flammeovirga aprica]NME71169.1 DUF1232 domain-containing protein [Flammeovirga aprica JL-4]
MNYKGIVKYIGKESVKFSSKFTEKGFWEKLGKYSQKAGMKLTFYAITLFYTMIDEDTPSGSKLMIMGALGYFIFPLDLIPDIAPGIGFTDDLVALTGAFVNVAMHVKPEHKQNALKKMQQFFGKDISIQQVEL